MLVGAVIQSRIGLSADTRSERRRIYVDILTLMLPDEVAPDASELAIGVIGRGKRGRDAETLRVVHVEDRR